MKARYEAISTHHAVLFACTEPESTLVTWQAVLSSSAIGQSTRSTLADRSCSGAFAALVAQLRGWYLHLTMAIDIRPAIRHISTYVCVCELSYRKLTALWA